MTPWRDPLDEDEAAEVDARELSEAAWLRFESWLAREWQ